MSGAIVYARDVGDEDQTKRIETANARLVFESERLCRRYIEEVVLGFKLCPWALPAVRDERIQIRVITKEFSSTSDLRRATTEAEKALRNAFSDPNVELVLVTFPRFSGTRIEFDHVLRDLRGLHEVSSATSEERFALAAFHPAATPDDATAERLIPYFRRSPDPTIQAVRTSLLESLEPAERSGTALVEVNDIARFVQENVPFESLRTRIAKNNLSTLGEVGRDVFEATLVDILKDRARTYEALVPPEFETTNGVDR